MEKEIKSTGINNPIVKCCRCRNKHKYSERVEKPSKMFRSFRDLVCPKCGALTYYELKDNEFKEWLKQVKKEQKYYPLFNGVELDEEQLRDLWQQNKTPVEALNDLSTSC